MSLFYFEIGQDNEAGVLIRHMASHMTPTASLLLNVRVRVYFMILPGQSDMIQFAKWGRMSFEPTGTG